MDQGNKPGVPVPDYTPATTRARATVGATLLLFTVLTAIGWFALFNHTQSKLDAEYRVPWKGPAGVVVSPGPSSFFVDSRSGELVTRGPIDTDQKRDLAKLVSRRGQAVFPPNAAGVTYWQALDRLAYQSDRSNGAIDLLLLVLGGLSGLLGVFLRSVWNFVGVACFKNNLDVVRWWPWYVVRPAGGFIFGLVAMLLIRVGILQPDAPSTRGVTWALVVSLLAGFSTGEFSDRLRLLAKTLFGESSGQRDDNHPATNENADPEPEKPKPPPRATEGGNE